MSPSAPLILPWQYPVAFPISSVRPLQRWRWVAGIKDVDAVPPHRHERARGETIDRLPFAFDRRQRVAPDGTLAPSLALRQALLGCAHRFPGNLLSALRHMIGWMIDEEHIEPDDDPTIGLKSGKAKASRESGGWVPWTEEDMAKYRARWPLGTEARLMFDILHYTHLRLGDASRFGPEHLQRTLKTMMVKVATEKSKGRTRATVPVHREFAVSLAAARNAGVLGMGEVFTGKLVKGEIMPMNKKAWAAKFKKYARLAGVNEPKKNCHGVRKARAEVAAYSDCTEAQMMAMFGWRDNKMPALYIAKANLDKLAIGGMAKIEAYDQTENVADLAIPTDQNRIVTFESNRRKKP